MPATVTRRAALTAGGAALLLVPVGGWYVASAAAAANVRVELNLAWCRDTPLRREKVADEDTAPTRIEVLAVTPRTRCRYHVWIRNDGVFPVHLDRGVAPALGPAAGDVLEARVRLGRQSPAVADPDDVDAAVPLDQDLAAGESTGFWILLSARDDGCTADRTTILDWPRVEISSLGRDVDVTMTNGPGVTFRWDAGQGPGCRT